MRPHVLAVDFGGTNLRFALVTAAGQVLERFSAPTRAEQGPEITVARLLAGIGEMVGRKSRRRVRAIGIGLPGPLDSYEGVVIEAPNLPGWRNVPLRHIVEEEFGLPVKVENDANCAAVGEHWVGAGRDVRTMIHLTLGTGIGAGVIIDDELLTGRDGCAGELGHVTINPKGPRCGCGNRGCLEVYASAGGMLRRFGQRLRSGERSPLRRQYLEAPGSVTARDLTRAERAGDRLAASVIEETGVYLGIAIAGFVNVFNPEMVVLSGGIANSGPTLFEPLRREVRRRAFQVMTSGLKIVRSKLGDNAGLLGAAKVAFNMLD